MIKMRSIFGILLTFLVVQSCDFSNVIPKDYVFGSKIVQSNMSSKHVVMEVNGKSTTNNEFTYGDHIQFSFNEVEGLKNINGSVYPGMSMYIVKNKIDTVYREDDLFSEYTNGTKLSPLKLEAFFKTAVPCFDDEKYKVFLRIWDKKGRGTITYEMPFTVKPSEALSIESNELVYSNIYFWNETEQKVVADKNIEMTDDYMLIIEGLEGFDLMDSTVYPALKIEITDQSGKQIIFNENILEEIQDSGLFPDNLRDNQIPVTISFTPGEVNNPCQMAARLTDLKNPAKYISIEAELIIE